MLSKLDLAKQFEIVTKQEIKNYQDSLNFVLQSIRDIHEDLKNIHDESLENYAAIHGQQVNLEIQLSNIKDIALLTSRRFESHANDQRVLNQTNDINMRYLLDLLVSKNDESFKLKTTVESSSEYINRISDKADKYHLNAMDGIEDLAARLRKEIVRTKEDILSRPSEMHIIQRQLEEKIACHAIDVEGIMKEIRIANKNTHILEKKIENIYTLIERLK